MKIAKHISFFFIENRLKFIEKIIEETNNYEYTTDIFIHTNYNFSLTMLSTLYKNGSVQIICHDLSNIHPYYLTWKCRDLLITQKDEYDIFMYIEDDILVKSEALNYWLAYNEELIKLNYNLGFMRIEIDESGDEYITDLYADQLDKHIVINGYKYAINDKNPYCAFWIYNKNEFNKYINSNYYDMSNIRGGIRESAAFGLHDPLLSWYTNTIIPIIHNKLINSCKVYHLSNNYVNDNSNLVATRKFNDALHNTI